MSAPDWQARAGQVQRANKAGKAFLAPLMLTEATQFSKLTSLHRCSRSEKLDIPLSLQIYGEDISPGIKKGGFVRYVRWTIKCRCTVPHIPSEIPLDVSKLELGSKVFLDDINLQLAAMSVFVREKVS